MKLTNHASKRMQQRHLPPLIVDLLQHYGQTRHQNGSTVLFFDAKGKERAKRELCQVLARFDKLRDAYLVEANDSGQVVTLGYRDERIKEK
jgi:prepilin-type processing-associated H-X9-DG protein